MIHIIENFIDEGRALALLEFCQAFGFSRRGGDGFWDGKVMGPCEMPQPVLAPTVEVVRAIGEEIRREAGQMLYPDCFNLVRWMTGDSMGLHADGDYPDGSFSWRLYGAVPYLSDDHEGGETYFPNQNLELKPKPGTLVFFPGHKPYLHGVREVTRGPRYNLASFWTADKARDVLEQLDG